MPFFSQPSRDKLATCHPDLQKLFNEVIKHYDCTILCGHRNEEDQNEAFLSGHSKARWGQSKHNDYPSKAVDVAPFPLDWNNQEAFFKFSSYVFQIANYLGIQIQWGGNFRSFQDMPHYELVSSDLQT